MNLFKKTAVATMLAAGLFTTTSATAATLDTDVDISFPSFLVLQAYTDAQLEFEAGYIPNILSGGTCTGTANDCANNVGSKAGTVTISGGVADLELANDDDNPAASTSVNLTLENAWSVYGLGGNFTANVTDRASDGSVSNFGTNDGSSTTLSMTPVYGDVTFTVDLTHADAADGVSAYYTVQVSGF